MPQPANDFRLTSGFEWWDPDAGCTLAMSQPSVDRELWMDYLRGAQRSYRKHGVDRALDFAEIRSGEDTIMFWATVDSAGRVVGGVRAKGPLGSADDSHAVIEWAGQPGLRTVRKMITDRVPFGILEMKSAWVTDDPDNNSSVIRALARSGFHAMSSWTFSSAWLHRLHMCWISGARQEAWWRPYPRRRIPTSATEQG